MNTTYRDYAEGRPGFYVVNPKTEIAVFGPVDSEEVAFAEADRINDTPPIAPDRLRVVKVEDA